MDIQPIVIGTAGHIDHGKSTLVRALTGIDPDRLKEERERGMTIDLGFAPLRLSDGRTVGIVDVPGHERFIRNMVAGASGIDLVVLVVAADDGVMPQTREHLQIMQLLGVRRGVVALTKVDLVDRELVDLAEEDVRDCVRGTFLDGAPLFRVSAPTGEGLEAFRDALVTLAAEVEPREVGGIFRMPIQRVFTKEGFGTVLTGIPVSGRAAIGDVLEVLPGGFRGKVRGLNAYKERADAVRSGHSSAINLTDVDKKGVSRGHVVATPGFFRAQTMVAARFEALADVGRPITNRMLVRLHTGTADPFGEIVLLDREEIGPGESGLVQLRLVEPVVCAPGDPFVLRRLSPVVTLGGGTILEESEHRLKRFKGFVVEGLAQREESLASPDALLETVLREREAGWVTTDELAVVLKQSKEETEALLARAVEGGRVRAPRPDRWLHVETFARARERLLAALDAWFETHPHRAEVDVLELRRETQLEAAFLALVVEAEVEVGRLESLPGGKVRDLRRRAELSPELERACAAVRERLDAARFQPPRADELAEAVGVPPKDLQPALEVLLDAGEIDRVAGDLFMARTALDEARTAIVTNCERNGQLQIPELRDALGTTRKFLIPLLEYFDAKGLTLRQGGYRVLKRR